MLTGCSGGGNSTSASTPPAVVDGSCGSANEIAVSLPPTAGLCTVGGATAVGGFGPWTWSCEGAGGGTNASCSAPVLQAAGGSTPGLSPTLSANPPYTCATNVYVDGVNGNDSNPGTQAQPWQTIQRADGGGSYPFYTPVAGECINVLPGTYSINTTIIFSHGGNANSPTGFVVYRSTMPQAAHILASSQFAPNTNSLVQIWAAYIVVDGFEVDGNHSVTSGHGLDGCANGGDPTYDVAHHFTAMNNLIHDMGGAGLSSCAADYITWEHNVVYSTSSTSPYETSGIGVYKPYALTAGVNNYNPTAADNVAFGTVIEYNIAHDNFEGNNSHAQHTDGNGIIIDTTFGSDQCPACGTPYHGNTLVLGNVSYNNGGGGVHVFLSENVTIANNTAYNNYLDTLNPGTARGELSNGASANINWINNIAYSVPGSGALVGNAPVVTFPLPSFPDSGTFTNNIPYGAPSVTDANDYLDPSQNLVGVNPMLTDPAAANFVPLTGSPAIGAGTPESYIPSSDKDIGAY